MSWWGRPGEVEALRADDDPEHELQTTTGIVSRGETARTITPPTAAAMTMTSAEVSSTPAATVTPIGS